MVVTTLSGGFSVLRSDSYVRCPQVAGVLDPDGTIIRDVRSHEACSMSCHVMSCLVLSCHVSDSVLCEATDFLLESSVAARDGDREESQCRCQVTKTELRARGTASPSNTGQTTRRCAGGGKLIWTEASLRKRENMAETCAGRQAKRSCGQEHGRDPVAARKRHPG